MVYKFKGLTRLYGKITKRKVFGFDTETANNNKDLVCVSIVGDNYLSFFDNKEDFIKEITTNRIFRNSYICATNLLFDLFSIFSIEEALSMFKIIERNGSLVLAKTYIKYDVKDNNLYNKNLVDNIKNYYPITFIDSANHLPAKVETLGKIVNLPKLDKPDFLGEHPKTYEEFEYLKKYNIRDSTITYKFMEFIQDNYNMLGCNLKITSSGTSIDLLRRKYLNVNLKQEPVDHIKFNYKSYYGGRTEIFKRGIFNIDNYNRLVSYDVNSLYPFAMQKNKYPYPDGYLKNKITDTDINSFEGSGHFELKAPKDLMIPVLPVKTNKLLFPTGNIKGYYDFNSIRLALKKGYEIISTGEGIIYENTFTPFKDMITELYTLRKKFKDQNNKAELGIKINLNSAYGKFGYNYANKELLCIGDELHKIDQDTASIYPTKDNNIYKIVTTEDSYIPNYVFPVFSNYTTSYAREIMYDYYTKLGSDHLFYTDTDCLFTDKKLPESNDLGGLKLENEFTELCLVKPKFYSGITKKDKELIKIKGLYGSIKSYNKFKDMILKNSFSVKTYPFRKLRSAIGSDNKYVNQIYEMSKHMDINDTKRIWEKNHFTEEIQSSSPIIL